MAFGIASIITVIGRAMAADRMKSTPSTYTNSPKYIGAGVGATGAARTAAASDTALSSELTEGRVSATESVVTVTTTGDTYQRAGSITATGSRAVDEVGGFDASTSGNMEFSATIAPINLVNGATLTLTLQRTFS